MFILTEPIIFYPLIGALSAFASYFYWDRILTWLHDKSLGSRQFVLEKLETMFVETDSKKVTLTMIAISFGPGFLIFFILLPNLILGMILGGIVTILGWQVPRYIIQYLFKKRSDLFVSQMVDGLTLLSNGVRSGLTVPQSMERVVENLPAPINQEFGLVLSQMRLGLSLEEALNNLGERVPMPDVQMFVTTVNILKETGGDMSETFSIIVETIRERQKIQKKIEALTAQGLMQGVIMTLVPFVLMIGFLIFDPEYVMPMFSTTFGIILLFIMLILQAIGGVVIKRVVTIKV